MSADPQPPTPRPTAPPPPALAYATPEFVDKRCPRCGVPAARPVSFTWWGGALGPKLFNHHKCNACQHTFNGKTGQPNTTAITIYVTISTIIAIAVGIAIFYYRVF